MQAMDNGKVENDKINFYKIATMFRIIYRMQNFVSYLKFTKCANKYNRSNKKSDQL